MILQNQPTAKILAHSINSWGSELITFEIKCHRWILAEINTHRVFSRNWRSSRAVPFERLLAEVREYPARPIVWMKNKPGMQASEPMSSLEQLHAEKQWLLAAKSAADAAEDLAFMSDIHKQWVNRILEPYLFVTGVISSTEWDNFYALRRHKDAQPEFKALADVMWQVHRASVPVKLLPNSWHLPYITAYDRVFNHPADLRRISVARVARASYKPFDGNADYASEFARHDKLLTNKHMSPFEHQAREMFNEIVEMVDDDPLKASNFHYSWVQYRKLIPNENIASYTTEYDV